MIQARHDDQSEARAQQPDEVLLAVVDRDLRLLELGPVLLAQSGLSSAEARGRSISELLPALAATVGPSVRQVLATGRPVLGAGACPDWHDGQCTSFYPLRSRSGEVVAVDIVASASAYAGAAQRAAGDLSPAGTSLSPLGRPPQDERRWRALIENIDQGFCIFEMIYDEAGQPVDYHFLEVNPTFERHTGLQNAVGKTARELVPGLEMDWVRIYAQVAEGDAPLRFEQGSAAMGRWFEVEAAPVGGPGRREVALLFTDITARRLAEADARFLSAVNEQIRVATRGDTLLWTVTEMLGRHLRVARCCFIEVDEVNDRWVIHRDFRDSPTMPSAAGVRAISAYPVDLLATLKAGRVVAISDTVIDPQTATFQGGFRPLGSRAMVSVPLLREGALVAAFAAFAAEPRDWSAREVALLENVVAQAWGGFEQLRSVEGLLASQASLTLALEAGKAGTFEWDMGRNVCRWSPQLEALYGVPPGTFAPTFEAWSARVEPDDACAIEEGIRATLRARAGEYAYEFRAVLPDGSRRWLAGRARLAYTPDGTPLHMHGINIDIDERKRGEAERATLLTQVQEALQATSEALARAEEATRERDLLISIAAHDLRSPLTAILGQAQLLQRRAASALDERGQRALATVVSQAERLNHMILALLDLSRIQEGRLTIQPQRLDLVTLLERVVAEVRLTTEAHALRLCAPPAPLYLDADPIRLEQVLHNLLGNAIKYSPDGGPIEVTVERDGGAARVSIHDEGIGIPTVALPHLFTRFYRAPNSAAQASTSSMGVGLYIVRELVQAHGGTVAVDTVEGAGSTFTIRLPLP